MPINSLPDEVLGVILDHAAYGSLPAIAKGSKSRYRCAVSLLYRFVHLWERCSSYDEQKKRWTSNSPPEVFWLDTQISSALRPKLVPSVGEIRVYFIVNFSFEQFPLLKFYVLMSWVQASNNAYRLGRACLKAHRLLILLRTIHSSLSKRLWPWSYVSECFDPSGN